MWHYTREGSVWKSCISSTRPCRRQCSSCPCHYEQIPQATWLGPLRQPPVSWCLGPKICKSCSSWFHFPPPYQIDKGCRPQFFLTLFKKPLPPVVLNRLQFLDGLCKKRVIVWCNKIRCTSLVQTSFLWNFIFLLWINNVRHGCSQYHFWYQEKYTTTNTGWPFQWQLVLSSTRILFFRQQVPFSGPCGCIFQFFSLPLWCLGTAQVTSTTLMALF